ncbi:MAG: C40 family peptidase [Chitinophagaceae bacterium]|nr:C40 family peptidase [Chitinophagaceae bacterium]
MAKAPEIIYSDGDSFNTKNEPEIKDAALRKKYAEYLEVDSGDIKNIKLYRFIDEWINTPYLMGGNSKQGIDCSAFVQRLYNSVYQVNVPRTSVTQFFHNNVEPFGGKQYLTEGDLVFFKTIKGTTVSHVGFYLANNYFVHASSSYGVSIARLDSPYWKSKYVACGRIKQRK